ncbi:MAG TPA: ABC transporter permease [Flavitalea sp.]|nr:ABC transporter permease [Flavitalea sp.]
MFRNYLTIALRNLFRNKIYSLINISGLSIGLACCMLIILYGKDEISYDRFHAKAENIFRIVHQQIGPDGKTQDTHGNTGMMPGPAFKREIPEIEDFVRVQGERIAVKIGTTVYEEEGIYADENFFSIFSFPMIAGDPFTALKNVHSIVLSEEAATKFFGKGNHLGKSLELPLGKDRSFETFMVTGIVPKSPQNSSLKLRMIMPMKLNERNGGGDIEWINFFLNTFVVLNPAADVKKVESKIKEVYERNAKDQIREAKEKYNMQTTIKYQLQPLLKMHLSKEYQADNGLTGASDPLYSKILGGIALFILLIACINFINLTVARSLKRAKEIGIRKVVGSERSQLIFQFLGESFLLSLIAFLLALGLVQVSLPLFNSLANKALALSYLLDASLITGYIVLFLITGFLAGFYPALVLSRFDPAQTLYNRLRFAGKNYLSKSLVVLQFTLSTFLIIATITIYSQFNFLTHRELGYNDKNVVSLRTSRMNSADLNLMKHELLKGPGIKMVTARQGGSWGTIAKVNGIDMDFALEVIDDSYLKTYEIPLAKGRNLSADYPSDSTESILINETFATKAGWKDPIGKQVDFFYNNHKYTVVGVVRDYHFSTLLEKIGPQLFTMDPKYDYGQLIIRISPDNTSATLKFIETVYKKLLPFVPYHYEFKDAANILQYEAEEKWKQIISFSALLTIFISCIGLFGLATLAAEKRTKEIGIRKVLGATVSNVVAMLSRDFVKLVLIAAVIAIPAAWIVMNKWLQNYPYRINLGPAVFAFASLLVIFIALATVSYQGIRAAVTNPARSLRTE